MALTGDIDACCWYLQTLNNLAALGMKSRHLESQGACVIHKRKRELGREAGRKETQRESAHRSASLSPILGQVSERTREREGSGSESSPPRL